MDIDRGEIEIDRDRIVLQVIISKQTTDDRRIRIKKLVMIAFSGSQVIEYHHFL